jgi:soluble P-type ATPase
LEHLIIEIGSIVDGNGDLIDGAATQVGLLQDFLNIHLAVGGIFDALPGFVSELGCVKVQWMQTGADKVSLVRSLHADSCAAIGGVANDAQMLRDAALSFAVAGSREASLETIATADIICLSITDALDLLLDPDTLIAVMRT